MTTQYGYGPEGGGVLFPFTEEEARAGSSWYRANEVTE